MREQKISRRDWGGADGLAASYQSDFSPAFWLATGPGGRVPPAKRRWSIAGIPFGYPILIGAALTFAYFMKGI